MTRIPVKPAFALTDLKDKTKIMLPIADRHTLDVDGLGLPKHITTEVLEWSLTHQLMDAPSHGLTSGDVGKTLTKSGIYDDVIVTDRPSCVLMEVIDANILRVAFPGAMVRIPIARLERGVGHVYATHGRRLWYDKSTNWYRELRPADSARTAPAILYIVDIATTTFDAVILPLESIIRYMTPYVLTSGDIAAKEATIIAAGAAYDVMLFAGGVLLSDDDATFSSLLGKLSWTGKALDTVAVAGMKIQGTYEPYP